ncbi:MAG: pyridoxal-phosphate dependent enzyme, partial [Pseudomonadota bacterium]
MLDIAHLDPAEPLALLQACPMYRATSLETREVDGRTILIKDETQRMGLGAFKALGGIYAVAKLIEAEMGRPLGPEGFTEPAVRDVAKTMTFVCASAGNHGMSVAVGATHFGAKARIYLSETVPEHFAERLQAKGAEVVRAGKDYEASIEAAIADAERTGAIHLADGSWPGYTEPPRLVMEGYTVMAEEMREEFEASGRWPSHVYLQAGVGGLAAGVTHAIRARWSVQPKIIVVEPEAAQCLAASHQAGQMVTVEGPVSNMGRLDCKTPSMLAFDILSAHADQWSAISDTQADDAVARAADLGFST